MKKLENTKLLILLFAAITLILSYSHNTSAGGYHKAHVPVTHRYECLGHKGGYYNNGRWTRGCASVTLIGVFESYNEVPISTTPVDAYWTDIRWHWPASFELGTPTCHKGYARGTYTFGSSFVYKWFGIGGGTTRTILVYPYGDTP